MLNAINFRRTCECLKKCMLLFLWRFCCMCYIRTRRDVTCRRKMNDSHLLHNFCGWTDVCFSSVCCVRVEKFARTNAKCIIYTQSVSSPHRHTAPILAVSYLLGWRRVVWSVCPFLGEAGNLAHACVGRRSLAWSRSYVKYARVRRERVHWHMGHV